MVLKRFIFLVMFANFIDNNVTLTCHGCMTSTQSDCVHGVETSFFINSCAPTTSMNLTVVPFANRLRLQRVENEQVEITTVCVRYAYKDKSDVFVRGCGYIYTGVDICTYLEATTDTIGCAWCNADLCNNQPGWN